MIDIIGMFVVMVMLDHYIPTEAAIWLGLAAFALVKMLMPVALPAKED